MEMEFVVFQLDRWRYAIAAAAAIEVAPAATIVPLPKAPPIVEGLINLRGRLVPVLDIRARFGLASKSLALNDHLLIAATRSRVVALAVDSVTGITRIADDIIEDARRSVPSAAYVAGVAKLPDGLILIHDLETFLAPSEDRDLDVLLPAESVS